LYRTTSFIIDWWWKICVYLCGGFRVLIIYVIVLYMKSNIF